MSMRETIDTKIREALDPVHLDVVDETPMHNVPPGTESHFRLLVVSAAFEGKPLLQRHRAIYKVLEKEKEESIHALALDALTPGEWEARGRQTLGSPPCLGGGKLPSV